MTLIRTENIKCDGDKCEHVRDQDSNHWMVGFIDQGRIVIAVNRKAIDHEPADVESLVRDFCGEECAIKWVSKQLTEIKK